MNPEDRAFKQIVEYCKAIGSPVRKERDIWGTTEEDVRRYVSGFISEGVFSEERFVEDFRNTIIQNLEDRLSRADSPTPLNQALHQAKDVSSAVFYEQVLVDVNGFAVKVAEKTNQWMAEIAYDRMKATDLAPLARHLQEVLGESEVVRKFDEHVLGYFQKPLNEALEGDDFESISSNGTRTFRSVMSNFGMVMVRSPRASSMNLEEYLNNGLRGETAMVEEVLSELQETKDAERDYLTYIEGLTLVGNETRELWVDLYEREQASVERFQRFVSASDSLRKVAIKLRNCFSPQLPDEAVLVNVYRAVDLPDEQFQFKYGQPPLLGKIRQAERAVVEIEDLYKKKVHETLLYRGWFDHCNYMNRSFERAEELQAEIKRFDGIYTAGFRNLKKPLICESLDFV